MAEQDNPTETDPGQPKSRLDNPFLRLISILVAIASLGVLFYSFTIGLYTIPVMTVVFFVMLWFLPQLWKWLEFVFSRQPSSKWGRFALNLVIAILLASVSEDILEIVFKVLRLIVRTR